MMCGGPGRLLHNTHTTLSSETNGNGGHVHPSLPKHTRGTKPARLNSPRAPIFIFFLLSTSYFLPSLFLQLFTWSCVKETEELLSLWLVRTYLAWEPTSEVWVVVKCSSAFISITSLHQVLAATEDRGWRGAIINAHINPEPQGREERNAVTCRSGSTDHPFPRKARGARTRDSVVPSSKKWSGIESCGLGVVREKGLVELGVIKRNNATSPIGELSLRNRISPALGHLGRLVGR